MEQFSIGCTVQLNDNEVYSLFIPKGIKGIVTKIDKENSVLGIRWLGDCSFSEFFSCSVTKCELFKTTENEW